MRLRIGQNPHSLELTLAKALRCPSFGCSCITEGRNLALRDTLRPAAKQARLCDGAHVTRKRE